MPRRGRPPKYGRPARVLALTLPEDVLAWLRGIHADPGWAIEMLFRRATRRNGARRQARLPRDGNAALVAVGGRQSLIVVDPKRFRHLRGVSTIRLTPASALLALRGSGGMADLELAVLDRLEAPHLAPAERRALLAIRRQLRDWRRSGRFRFSTRSIILVERSRRRDASERASRRR